MVKWVICRTNLLQTQPIILLPPHITPHTGESEQQVSLKGFGALGERH